MDCNHMFWSSVKENHLVFWGRTLLEFAWKKTTGSSMKEEFHWVFYGRRIPLGLLWKKKTTRTSIEKEGLLVFNGRRPLAFFWNKRTTSLKEDHLVFCGRFSMEEEGHLLFFGRRRPLGLLWKKKATWTAMEEEVN